MYCLQDYQILVTAFCFLFPEKEVETLSTHVSSQETRKIQTKFSFEKVRYDLMVSVKTYLMDQGQVLQYSITSDWKSPTELNKIISLHGSWLVKL